MGARPRNRQASGGDTVGPQALHWSWARGPQLAAALLLIVIAGGTSGYVLIEGWSPWEAFYMTVTTVATVGYREVHPLSFAGQAFTIALIVGGVGTAFYTATLVATLIVEGGLHRRFEQRRLTRMLQDLKDHFIVCGFGRIGSIIAAELKQQDVPFIVIERNPDRVDGAMEAGWLAVEADASREDVLSRAGIARARGLIAAVGTDAENVYAVLTARGMRQDLFIIARVESEDAEHKLRRAGADRVISPYQIGATHIVQTALRPAVVDFFNFATSSEHLELSMEQVHVPEQSPLAGTSLVDAGLRQKYGVIIVAIKRTGGAMEFNPAPESVIRAGDELVVLGQLSSVKALEASVGA
ncbi:MAG: potassium channel protein [Acidobacteria bacterium]|nr:potassium channel protein [Acidobacteriota bacterium]